MAARYLPSPGRSEAGAGSERDPHKIHPYYQDTPVVERMRENISIFDFSLSEDEMGKIAALNRNEKHDWYCVY